VKDVKKNRWLWRVVVFFCRERPREKWNQWTARCGKFFGWAEIDGASSFREKRERSFLGRKGLRAVGRARTQIVDSAWETKPHNYDALERATTTRHRSGQTYMSPTGGRIARLLEPIVAGERLECRLER
jgi:hypothetical protein